MAEAGCGEAMVPNSRQDGKPTASRENQGITPVAIVVGNVHGRRRGRGGSIPVKQDRARIGTLLRASSILVSLAGSAAGVAQRFDITLQQPGELSRFAQKPDDMISCTWIDLHQLGTVTVSHGNALRRSRKQHDRDKMHFRRTWQGKTHRMRYPGKKHFRACETDAVQ